MRGKISTKNRENQAIIGRKILSMVKKIAAFILALPKKQPAAISLFLENLKEKHRNILFLKR
jgi:hypothetical protein